jgi:NitT/TauT family transport system substrate-binding protein
MGRRRWIYGLALGAVLALGVTACGGDEQAAGGGSSGSGASPKLTKVALRLNWVLAGNHAPFYLAQEKGYWKSCGLDVSLAAGTGSGDTAKLVANGSQDFGLTDAVSIVSGRAQGLKIKSIGVVYQTNPSSLVSKKETGITDLKAVAGKTWGAVPGGSPYLLLKALFKSNGIDESSVKEVSVPSPGIAQLKTGQVDYITFFGNEVANIDPDWQKNLNVVTFEDYGQNIYGLALAASDDYIQQHPDRVKCMRDGVIKGFQEAKANPDEALKALTDAVPETEGKDAVNRQLLDGAFQYAGDDLLAQDKAKWQATQKVLVDADISPKSLPATDFYSTAGQ